MRLLLLIGVVVALFSSCSKTDEFGSRFLVDPEFESIARIQKGSKWVYANSDSTLFDTVTLTNVQYNVNRVLSDDVESIQSVTMDFVSSIRGNITWVGEAQAAGKSHTLVREISKNGDYELFFTQLDVGAQVDNLMMDFKSENLQVNKRVFKDVRGFRQVADPQGRNYVYFSPNLGVLQRRINGTVWMYYEFIPFNE